MSSSPNTPPSPPTIILNAADYTDPQVFCAAQNAVLAQGYVFSYIAIKGVDSWITYVGTWIAG
jgi:hypothetical protein